MNITAHHASQRTGPDYSYARGFHRTEIETELEALGHEQEAIERAARYAQLVRSRGIGRFVLVMPPHDRRRFFRTAFDWLTLDGRGRGRWRTREIVGYELSGRENTFIVRRASA